MFLIYQDYVHNNGGLWRVLTQKYGSVNVRFVDASDILNGALTHRTQAFFMPGGASRYVAEKLNGQGNHLIRSYVASGGVYVGICAGAYYACRRTEWNDGASQVFHIDNELAFCPAVAVGDLRCFKTSTGKSAAITTIITSKQKSHDVLYWQGPVFHHLDTSITQHAWYKDVTDQPCAVISGNYGQGSYLLISPHLEIDRNTLHQMQFNVVDNRHSELANLDGYQGLGHDYFIELLTNHVG